MSALFCLLLQSLPALQTTQDESAYWEVQYYSLPEKAVLEVGGIAFLPDGRMLVSTRRGELWAVENPLAEKIEEAHFQLIADGLQEGLGLCVADGEIYLTQRAELSRLRDSDGDQWVDTVETICNQWGVSGNYHEFAYGLPRDAAGNFYVSLNVAFFDPKWWHGKAPAPYRGWVVQISPDGRMTPYASGLRSPCGMGMNAQGELFVTDNQGDWVASSPIYHVREGHFYGHPASLDWSEDYRASQTQASDTQPPARQRTPPAIWLPYKWSRSAGNLVQDQTQGRFGPYAGDFIVAELTNGMLLRAQMEQVQGAYQGACFLFRQRIGSATRVQFAPDGSLIVGFTNRGWGGYPPGQGLARVRWTGRTPLDIERVHLLQDGFELTLTEALASEQVVEASSIEITSYDYDYWWEYGSPERHTQRLQVGSVEVSADRQSLFLRAVPLLAATCVRVRLPALLSASGQSLLHDEFHYTINQLPEGPPTSELVAKLVPSPPARESGAEGWLRLTFGDALDAWQASGWKACDAELDPGNRKTFTLSEGNSALVNLEAGPASPFTSKFAFADARVHAEFMLPEQGNSGLYMMGRYELQLLDSQGKEELAYGDCGGIYRGENWPGAAPALNAFREAGAWHDLDLTFEAPRFDAAGKKLRNARFVRVLIDDVLLHENVEVPEPTLGAFFAGEAPSGPLVLQADHGPVAFRELRVFPIQRPREQDGWTAIFDGESIADWTSDGNANWEVADGILRSSGERGHLFSPRADYANCDIRARLRISDGGNSGLYFRSNATGEWPEGYEAQINSNFPDPQKTGSLYGRAQVLVQLIPADTWFDYEVHCRDEAAGTRISIFVNSILVSDFLDSERSFSSGHIALQQHHAGSVLELERLEVREH